MKSPTKSYHSTELTPGCHFLHDSKCGILIGCISEAIQYLANQSLGQIPIAGILLSDTAHAHGVSNWALEFPVCKHLFLDENKEHAPKLTIIGTKKQIARAKAILQITLFGPTRSQYKKWAREYGVPGFRYRMLERAGTAFAPQLNDEPATLDDLVTFVSFDKSRNATLGPWCIQHRGEDTYLITDKKKNWSRHYKLEFQDKPEPPFEITSDTNVGNPHHFAIQVLLNSNGLDHQSGCTSYIVWLNGKPFIWDAAPFVHESLRANGLDISEIEGVFITHIHDDHSSLLELMAAGQRIRLYATPEVYEGLMLKIGAIIDRNLQQTEHRESFLQLIDFHPIICGEATEIQGAVFKGHYSIHSVPTIGGKFLVGHEDKVHQLLITGDTAGPKKLAELAVEKKISARWLDETRSRITGEEDLIIYDGGANPAGLQADPEDVALKELAETMGDRLYFGHRSARHLKSEDWIHIAQSGFKRIFLDGTAPCNDSAVIQEAFQPYGFNSAEHLSTLLQKGEVVTFQPKETLIQEGDVADYVYVLTAGQLCIEIEGETVAILGKGTVFGEMAVLANRTRCATVKTISAVRLFKISKPEFIQFAEDSHLLSKFENLWKKRNQLMQTCIFKCLPSKTIESLTQTLDEINFRRGETIMKQGEIGNEAFIIIQGKVRVSRDGQIIAHLGVGNIFGEKAALDDAPSSRTATIDVEEDCKLLRISGEQLRDLNSHFFMVNDLLYVTLQKRSLLKV